MKIRVYYDSTDAGGIVYHTEYIKFCEQARSEIFFQHGIFFENEGYVVKELNAKYIQPAKLGDILQIKTKILKISKVKIDLSQNILKNGETIFTLTLTLAYIKNGKIAKIPQEHIRILNE